MGQCPKCSSVRYVDPAVITHLLCGLDHWIWEKKNKIFKTGSGWDESEWEKMN
jgi:hypothetical protein